MNWNEGPGMKFNIAPWEERFNELSLRERLLVVAVCLAFSYVCFDALLMTAMYNKQKQYQAETDNWLKQNRDITKHIVLLTEQLQSINGSDVDSEISQLSSKAIESKSQLEDIVVKFIKPKQIVSVLQDVLRQEKGLRLISMKSVAAIGLLPDQEIDADDQLSQQHRQVAKLLQFYQNRDKYGVEADYSDSRDILIGQQAQENRRKAGLPQIYKHGIMLELVGDYAATLRYLKNLEDLPWNFYWDAVRYEVTEYPKAKIRILVNTISLEKDWVRV